MSTHAKHGPSSLTWAAFSPKFRYMDAVDDRAEEGTALHEIAEKCIDYPDQRETRLEGLEPDQRRAVEYCLGHADHVLEHYGEECTPGSVTTYTELKVQGEPWEFGTVDLVVKGNVGGGVEEAHISDWKFGMAEVPSPPENLQMACYVQGVFNKFPKVQRVTVSLVSARLRKTYSHTYTRTDCAGIQRWAEEVILSKEDPSVPCTPSDACTRCQWRVNCSFLKFGLTEVLPPEASKVVFDLTVVENRPRILEAAKAMEEMARQMKLAVRECLENGDDVPGYKLQEASRSSGGVRLDEFFSVLSDRFPGYEPAELLSHGTINRTGMKRLVEDLCRTDGHPIKKTTDAFFEEAEARGLRPPVSHFTKMVKA